MKRALFLSIALVSIGFGVLKQIKTAVYSRDEMVLPKMEAGSDAAALKRALLAVKDLEVMRKEVISYKAQWDKPPQRPEMEYYYDAQYGFAPLVLTDRLVASGYWVIQFSSHETKDRYLRENNLSELVSEGLWVAAVPTGDR